MRERIIKTEMQLLGVTDRVTLRNYIKYIGVINATSRVRMLAQCPRFVNIAGSRPRVGCARDGLRAKSERACNRNFASRCKY